MVVCDVWMSGVVWMVHVSVGAKIHVTPTFTNVFPSPLLKQHMG